jgi:hypothetical protein
VKLEPILIVPNVRRRIKDDAKPGEFLCDAGADRGEVSPMPAEFKGIEPAQRGCQHPRI